LLVFLSLFITSPLPAHMPFYLRVRRVDRYLARR